MADTVEMQDIRGMDIDKTVKGFALTEYVFKGVCQVSSTSADHVRWYSETAADLTATAPSKVANISPLSAFPNLEVSWTRSTSYIKKYAAEGFISMEDMKSADIDVMARTLLRLTRAVVKQVDTDIFSVITEALSPVNINHEAVTHEWDDQTNANPITDLMSAKKRIQDNDYDPEGAYLFLNPTSMKDLISWLVYKGSDIPMFASEKVVSGSVTKLLGLNIKVSNNVTSDYGVIVIPQKACTWKSFQDTTSRAIEEPGIGTKFRVWELGVAILTDPKAVCLLSNIGPS